jgi:hypothetical protein
MHFSLNNIPGDGYLVKYIRFMTREQVNGKPSFISC